MTWKPHVTVAAVIEREGRFLLVEEDTEFGIKFNQPAGHLEPNETLIDAVIREVNEETAWQFQPEAVVAVQLWRKSPDYSTFLRFCFCGSIDQHNPLQTLDPDIRACHWLTREQIAARPLRSPLVLKTIDEFLSGKRHPLTLLHAFLDFS